MRDISPNTIQELKSRYGDLHGRQNELMAEIERCNEEMETLARTLKYYESDPLGDDEASHRTSEPGEMANMTRAQVIRRTLGMFQRAASPTEVADAMTKAGFVWNGTSRDPNAIVATELHRMAASSRGGVRRVRKGRYRLVN